MAIMADAVFGEPSWLLKRMPHPVVLMGKFIGWLDRRMNHQHHTPFRQKRAGITALIRMIFVVAALAIGILALAWWINPILAFVVSVLGGAIFLAQRSLHDHVEAVRSPLAEGDLPAARQALSMIVGRTTENLDESGVARAALESLAENLSDGVIAPAFWMLIGGLPGIALYKAINTADSMIGYKTERHLHFGWASAKLDDLVNFLPARLSVGLIMLSAAITSLAGQKGAFAWPDWAVIRRDAPTHASPNAGWPEASYASALGIALGGPRTYPSGTVEAPYINDAGRKNLDAGDIRKGLSLLRATCAATLLVVVLIAAAIGFLQ
ncbi:MAG: cobalamin biosynthesis protein CobD [Rhizobiales bacterium]|nr:cobalamin biosynthesis protein CobD [Hyphomicrobiales bacterium]MBO6698873.1 cobalamin biosynthesis protein CobD [Hyphomicrobiales bacterium]MBO6734874.1 cobalamin biosynthesis protein CobD [Hyphomicrobiales bacterium]MBO6911320.1 cobalamin biosynthesis protein CobD [Hyphomicrobiales bacterium]MBO6956182.1 cobalamin biosynthesis protein CobD [Hyphomicrobiales bacterium]